MGQYSSCILEFVKLKTVTKKFEYKYMVEYLLHFNVKLFVTDLAFLQFS